MSSVKTDQDAREYIVMAVKGCGFTISAEQADLVAERLHRACSTWNMNRVGNGVLWSTVQDVMGDM